MDKGTGKGEGMKNMIILTVIFIVTLFCEVNTCGAEINWKVSGKEWKEADLSFKAGYLMGLTDGSTIMAITAFSETKNRADSDFEHTKLLMEKLSKVFPSKITIKQEAEMLDKFYADYRNIYIPAVLALMAIKRELQGQSKEDIEKHLLELRKHHATGIDIEGTTTK